MIKQGDKVKFDYTGKLEDGTVFDTSSHKDHSHPLEFEVGTKQVIPGFEAAVIGMKVGEEKTFEIKPEEGYGMINPELVKKIPKTQIPDSDKVKKGMTLAVALPDGQQMPVSVVDVDEENVSLDMNHPLAGKLLTFDIKVISIN